MLFSKTQLRAHGVVKLLEELHYDLKCRGLDDIILL